MIPTIALSREARTSASRSRPLPPTITSHCAPSGRKRSRNAATPPTRRAMISPRSRSLPGSSSPGESTNYSRDFYPAIFEALFRSESWIALVMITDLLGRKDRFNVPGTHANSNWTRRLHTTVGRLGRGHVLHRQLRLVRELLERTGRAGIPNEAQRSRGIPLRKDPGSSARASASSARIRPG